MIRKRIAIDLGTPHRAFLLPRAEFIRLLEDARVPPKADRRKGAWKGQAANNINNYVT
ncbi:hypothetical protein IID22_03310 [Patescibacteria group bacterium]|nr:hypothetical protein [Patescibacteria group bacterium]